ncbi:SDR family NAD(P)-dependent oxidoreductase [Flindersiella endophytica]
MNEALGNARDLNGRTALVTGGAAGIGAAVAEALVRARAGVVIADRDVESGQATARRLGCAFLEADAGSLPGVHAMFEAVHSRWGPVDVLVNNAGGFSRPTYPEASAGHWLAALDLNLRAVMLATQLAIEDLADRGGAIVNVSSVAGVGHAAHPSPEYAVSKAGIVRLTACLAPLRESAGIRVTCVCPDLVDTPSSRRDRASMPADQLATLPPAIPPEEIADAVLRLVLDESLAGRAMVCRHKEPKRVLLPVVDWDDYIDHLATLAG